MGKKNDGNNDINITKPESESTTTKTGSTGNRSSKTTGTGSGSGSIGTGSGSIGTGSGRTETGSGTVGTGSTKTGKTEKISKVSVLDNLPEVNIPTPETPKQKRKYTKKVKEENTSSFDSKQISAFIVAVSSMVAARDGMQHWLITEAEAEQIAKPLSNIIEKSSHLKTLGEHADAFALVSACLMIFAPRLIMTMQIKKSKKGVKKVNGNNDTKSNTSNSNGVGKTQHTVNVKDVPQSILGEIPSII